MKLSIFAGLAIAAASVAFAAAPTCDSLIAISADDNLGYFVGLGSGGCSIGDLLFSNFSYTPTTGNPTAANITITDDSSTLLGPGLNFGATWSAAAGSTTDFHLGFTVSAIDGAVIIEDDSLSLGGTVGDTSSVSEEICEGFAFQPGGSTCINGSLQAAPTTTISVISTGPTQVIDHTFPAQSTVGVFKDISVINNGTGTVLFSSIGQNFSLTTSVPEPVGVLLFGSCMLLVAPFLRRRMSQR